MRLFSTREIKNIVNNGNCMSCGLCAVDLTTGKKSDKIEIKYSEVHDYFVPFIDKEDDTPITPCPGQDLNLVELTQKKFKKEPANYLLGQFEKLRISYSSNKDVRKNAASGGIITTSLSYLFKKELIDIAYVLDPGSTPYDSKGIVIDKSFDLSKLHGSTYHPTNFGVSIPDLIQSEKRFAFVGLPCHIEMLETLKQVNPQVKKNHIISIGLFCGGVNTFKGVDYYLKSFREKLSEVENIKYRVGNWPGKIQLTKSNSKPIIIPRIRGNTRFKILRYVIAFQGYFMLKRCRLCPDQVNDLADIAVGDPHLPELRKRKESGFSLVVTRSKRGEDLITGLEEEGRLTSEPISEEKVIKSQGYTLNNRRHVHSYLKINKIFGGYNPNFKLSQKSTENLTAFNYIYAFVDLFKVYLPKRKLITILYIPWQVFEYLFITLTPSIIVSRVLKLLTNK